MSSETHPITGMTLGEIDDLNADLSAENAALRQQVARQKTDFQNLHQTLLNREQKLSEAVKLLERIGTANQFLPVWSQATRVSRQGVEVLTTLDDIKAFLAAHKEGK